MVINLKFFFWLGLLLNGVTIHNCSAGIIFPQAPSGGEQAVSNLFNSNFSVEIHPSSAKGLTIARPFGVYWHRIDCTNAFAVPFLSKTELVGWYFLVSDDTNSAGLQLEYDEKKREWPAMENRELPGTGLMWHPAHPTSGDPMLKALQAAKNLPQVKTRDYELRYLEFLEIPFSAIWLHGKSNDLIIPVPAYGRWQDFRPYSEAEITVMLKREVEEEMKQSAQHGPPWRVD